VLAYYIATQSASVGELAGAVFMRENYGIALPSGSLLAEDVNQALLTLRENGEYEEIYRKWFGKSP
jgi:polar amino acid transport system substrate-binding protein